MLGESADLFAASDLILGAIQFLMRNKGYTMCCLSKMLGESADLLAQTCCIRPYPCVTKHDLKWAVVYAYMHRCIFSWSETIYIYYCPLQVVFSLGRLCTTDHFRSCLYTHVSYTRRSMHGCIFSWSKTIFLHLYIVSQQEMCIDVYSIKWAVLYAYMHRCIYAYMHIFSE